MLRRFAPAAVALLLCSSCQSVYKPKAPIPASVISTPALADLSQANLIASYDALPEGPAKIARRNQILWEVVWLTDQSYASYEAAFFSGQAYVGTGGDALAITLSSIAAVTGTAHLKSVLSAISGGAVGIESSYQKNFFDQATRESIVEVMRASRLAQLAVIQGAMANSSYTLEQGLMDTTAYFDAGTIVGALISISESSTQQASIARLTLKAIRAQSSARQ